MAAVDQIGAADGGVIHWWSAAQSQAIEEAFVLKPERSGIELEVDLDFLGELPAEVAAPIIAKELDTRFRGELGNSGYRLAGMAAKKAVSEFPWDRHSKDLEPSQKWLVDYIGSSDDVVSDLLELAWLRFALDCGATPADLDAWGVSRFTIAQLTWWQRRPGETRLQQHIRAIRNGWGLRYLDIAVRDSYRNLFDFIHQASPEWLAHFKADIDEIRQVQDFFADDAETLTLERQAEWAAAFLAAGITKIAPDATGRYAHFLPYSFKQGILRKPLEPIARYLEQIGVGPADWADFDESFFGRA